MGHPGAERSPQTTPPAPPGGLCRSPGSNSRMVVAGFAADQPARHFAPTAACLTPACQLDSVRTVSCERDVGAGNGACSFARLDSAGSCRPEVGMHVRREETMARLQRSRLGDSSSTVLGDGHRCTKESGRPSGDAGDDERRSPTCAVTRPVAGACVRASAAVSVNSTSARPTPGADGGGQCSSARAYLNVAADEGMRFE
jgi:hypothetical protein